jgi:hypothetical protein
MIDTVSGSDTGMVVDQLRDPAFIERAKGARHFSDVGGGAGRVPAIPRSVAANDQLAGLRLQGVHNPAIVPTFTAKVVISGARPQGGFGRTPPGQGSNAAGGVGSVKPFEGATTANGDIEHFCFVSWLCFIDRHLEWAGSGLCD